MTRTVDPFDNSAASEPQPKADKNDFTSRTAPYTVYHWDTFDNETFKVGEAETLEEADALVKKQYGARIGAMGADRVDVVDIGGRVVRRYSVG